MADRLNGVIRALESGKPAFATFSPASPEAAIAIQGTKYDGVVFETEHNVWDGTNVRHALQYLLNRNEIVKQGSLAPKITPIVRIPPNGAEMNQWFAKQALDLGAYGIVWPHVSTAEQAYNAVGTRAEGVGDAPARWGLSEKDYRARADVWPLNPKGELVTFGIVESKEGLARVREIAQVKGLGVLFPGAGTLRQVFTTTDASGKRTFDEAGWEAAIQQVLAACREFKVPCGYPAGAADIELRMKQGFSVFVIGWGEQGFKAVELGRAAGGR